MIRTCKRYLDCALNIGVLPSDSESLRIKKSSLLLLPYIIGPAAFLWGMLYLYLGHSLSASIPLSYSMISVFNLLHLYRTKDIRVLYNTQMILVLLLPFFLMWSLGGFYTGSFVFIWAFYAPIAALMYDNVSKAKYWFYAFMSLVIFSVLINQTLMSTHGDFLPPMAIDLFFLLNISVGFHGIYFLIKYFIDEKEKNTKELLQIEHDKLLKQTEELNKANLKLQHLAHHDDLTSLPNRSYLIQNMRQMMSYAKRNNRQLALLFLDLDGFKDVNDEHGHLVGDKILKVVAQRIKALLREEDTVARLGGDEFAILIGNITDVSYVEHILQRILDEINIEYSHAPSAKLGASIGVSLFPDHTQDLDTLIKYADDAMYTVKKSSKNSFAFHNPKAAS